MRLAQQLRRFLAASHGFVISTERILILTIVIGGLVVGVMSLRDALRNYFLDEVDAIAACTNTFIFNPAQVQVMTTTDFNVLFPNLATQVDRPVPTPATKEGS